MIGIKGQGMAMLAQYLHAHGYEVLGSDVSEKFNTDEVLHKVGIKVIESFNQNNIPKDADLIIYSTAYNEENNIEVKTALAGKIKTIKYAEALGAFFNQKYGLAVVGSHGKTTTTAWLGYVMEKSGLSPSVLVGAPVPQFNGKESALIGQSDYLVIEADEYQNKLKYINPKAVLLNNIDYDHPDFFYTREEYAEVFIDFIKKLPKKGFLIANFDDPIIRKTAKVNCQAKVISYGLDNEADFMAYDIKQHNGRQYFKVKYIELQQLPRDSSPTAQNDDNIQDSEELLGDFSIQLAGRHNIANALAVIAAGVELEISLTDIRKYLSEFTGTSRRMEVMGKFNGALIIDDYAHHPTEIKATIAGARQLYKNKKITVVFHPHTFTRTKVLLDDFAKSFNEADAVIILDIYGSAREAHGGVHSRDLISKLKAQNSKLKSLYIPTKKECEEYLRKNLQPGDVVLLMGAGDQFKIGEGLLNN